MTHDKRCVSDFKIKNHMTAIARIIRQYGWFVQGVFPTKEGDPSFAYTIGLTEAGLPELLISGALDIKLMQDLLNDAARIHLNNELLPGAELSDIANVTFKVRACGPHPPIQQALNYYRDVNGKKGRVRVLQLVWPDESGAYPGPFSTLTPEQQPLY